jgi:enoyl-CoA hydratase/carnithine racemase
VLLTQHSPAVTEIILNNPRFVNSVDTEMIETLLPVVKQWYKTKKHPRMLLMTGTGDNFCSGGDMLQLYRAREDKSSSSILRHFFEKGYLLDYSMKTLNPF